MNDLLRGRALAEIDRLIPELLDASQGYRKAKHRYARARASYGGSVYQDILTRDCREAKAAVADCSWYGSEMERIAGTVTALTLAVRASRPRPPASRRQPEPARPSTRWPAYNLSREPA